MNISVPFTLTIISIPKVNQKLTWMKPWEKKPLHILHCLSWGWSESKPWFKSSFFWQDREWWHEMAWRYLSSSSCDFEPGHDPSLKEIQRAHRKRTCLQSPVSPTNRASRTRSTGLPPKKSSWPGSANGLSSWASSDRNNFGKMSWFQDASTVFYHSSIIHNHL